MKIAAFVSSSTHNGNTAKSAKRILQGAADLGAETEIYYLNDYTIRPCRGCRVCETTNKCVFPDPDVDLLHKAIIDADAIIIGTPTYYADITGQFKQFVDRCYPFVEVKKDYETKQMSFGSINKVRKPGVMIAVSGNHGGMVLDSHLKVEYMCFNDLNVYPYAHSLVTKTSWKNVDEQPEKWEELYQIGQNLYNHLANGEPEDEARTQMFYDRYRLLKDVKIIED